MPEFVTVVFPTLTIKAAVARNSADLARGLMHVPRLKTHHGLLLAFPTYADQHLWMRNVAIPLDMIFLDSRTIVGIVHSAQPRSDTSRSIGRPSSYVLEVEGGTAAAHRLEPGLPWSMRR